MDAEGCLDLGFFLGRYSSLFETLVPFVTLQTVQTILPISLLQHKKSLC